nr:hypothetical protein NG677_17160 [Methylobacterium sp. OTU13CASTA1]
MEQGNRLDSTPVSAAPAVRDDAGEDRALDAAVAELLTSPSGDTALPVIDELIRADEQDLVDPALSAIEEGRRLLRAYLHAHETIKQDPTTLDPPSEWGEAGKLLWAHIDDVILKTVPQTGAGCRELARFANEYFQANEIPISDDEMAAYRLIAQSPLLDCASRNTPITTVEGPSSDLVALVTEWKRLLDIENGGELSDEEVSPICDARYRLHDEICSYPVASIADLAAKLPLFRDEIVANQPDNPQRPTMDYQSWCCIVRDLEAIDGVRAGNIGGSAATQRASAEAVDLSKLDISALCAFYEAAGAAREMWNGTMCLPIAVASGGVAGGFMIRTPFGDLASFEDGRLRNLRDRIVAEAEHRTPADRWDRDNLLGLRIQHEIACEGRICAPTLLADIAHTWARASDASLVGGPQR